ncbi:DNA cytosine methyltransferase [Gulosibacter sp. 10]|uniref:DNA cytosine methyltransferase n=1 Tax=Gulosibacter sp. 10 TaxID=1255570 RepID=UPI00097EC9C2|nr:DNA cytosine methyltransferase [Gulosibacter sp. 10]SJM61278.1 Phage protein [Gulosibacter sp. 10]
MLDLFCGQGGAAAGYADAGFDVIGVDIEDQPRYPYDVIVGDALELLRQLLDRRAHPVIGYALSDFDAIHASPPCQGYSTVTPDRSKHSRMIPAVRGLLEATGLPYVIENVEGARAEMRDPVRLCGSSFGLSVRRHRLFESSVPIEALPCDHAGQGTPVGVYGALRSRHWSRPDGTSRGRKATSVEEARDAMGMQWADWHGCTQAVPPAYTEHIGRALMAHLEGVPA